MNGAISLDIGLGLVKLTSLASPELQIGPMVELFVESCRVIDVGDSKHSLGTTFIHALWGLFGGGECEVFVSLVKVFIRDLWGMDLCALAIVTSHPKLVGCLVLGRPQHSEFVECP